MSQSDRRWSDLECFVHDCGFADLPADVVDQAQRCLLDLLGVAVGGSATELSRIIREHAVRTMKGEDHQARLLFDGRPVSPVGAALGNAATIDSIDGHDGHRLTKGHAGVAVLPAALALLEEVPYATTRDLLAALAVGYEVATRAGVALHAAAADYHSSGAWNALAAAAVGARLLGLDHAATSHAVGIAEYSAPRAPMMRCIEHPTMVKDSSAWGAQAGVSAAMLAADGFTGAPATLVGESPGRAGDTWDDLGKRWMIGEHYFKPYPVCRWSHPAIQAVIDAVVAVDVPAEHIDRVEVTTFHAATQLGTRHPVTTEEAQYSLPFSVAVAAVHRDLPPDVIVDPQGAGDHIRRLATDMGVHESAEMTAAFPASRIADVSLVLRDGRRVPSGPTTAAGNPEAPLTMRELTEKFLVSAVPVVGEARAQRLVHQVREIEECALPEFLDEIFRAHCH